MLSIETPRFGTVTFSPQEVVEFPAGLPGFDQEHEFLLVEPEASRPLCFLQSVRTPSLSFVCAPVALISQGYVGTLSRTDREILAMPTEAEGPGAQLEWLVILCFLKPELPTANLLGPLVLRRDIGLGLQSVREDSRYSARHPLFAERREQTIPTEGESRRSESGGAPCW